MLWVVWSTTTHVAGRPLSTEGTKRVKSLHYQPRILAPYVRADGSWIVRRSTWLIASAVFAAAALYGALFGVFADTLIAALVAPLALLLIFVFWVLPAIDQIPNRTLEFLFFAFFVVMIVWPNYLAVALPGLPWITMIRLIGFPLAALFVFCAFVSAKVRTTLRRTLASSPLVLILFLTFIALELFSVVVSTNPVQSLSKFVLVQITWTTTFFVGCYVFLKPGRAILWAGLAWSTAVVVALIGLREHSQGQVLWAGHIPGFLKVGDEVVQRILTPHFREYTGRYRTLSTFSTPLGFAEYLAFVLPFVLHFAAEARSLIIRIAAFVTVPSLIYVVLLTDSRLGMIGCFLAVLLYGLIWSVQRWRHDRSSLFGPAVALAYPLIIVGAVSLTFVSHSVHAVVWGGDATQMGSTDVRREQMNMAIPKIASRPWGYGMQMAADVVGYRTPGGILTLDSYYLTIVLEYGVIGFIVFYGMFGAAIFAAGRRLLSADKVELELNLLLPASLTLVNFIVIKSVFSQDDNHPVIFMVLAMIVALGWRYSNSPKSGVPNPTPDIVRNCQERSPSSRTSIRPTRISQ